MDTNLRADCSSLRSFPPEVDNNQDGHDDDEEDYNSSNHTNDHDNTWL